MNELDKMAVVKDVIGFSLNMLLLAAQEYPDTLKAVMQACALEKPEQYAALLKAAGLEVGGPAQSTPTAEQYTVVIGQPITHEGIYWGDLRAPNGKTKPLNLIPCFVKDADGNFVEKNGDDAIEIVKSFNGGLQHGNGYENANIQALAKGKLKKGFFMLARDVDLFKIAEERTTNPALKQINDIISRGSSGVSWGVSCSEYSSNASYVRHVSLRDGVDLWSLKVDGRSRLVLLRVG